MKLRIRKREMIRNLLARIPRIEFRSIPVERRDNMSGDSEVAEQTAAAVQTYYVIIVSTLFLAIVGLVMTFSSTVITTIMSGGNPYIAFLRPLSIIACGVLAFAAAQRVQERYYYRFGPLVFAVAIGLQCLVRTPLGVASGGNANWVNIPFLRIQLQPSELIKLGLILMLARIVTRPDARIHDRKQMLVLAGGASALAVGSILYGGDLGTSMVTAACALGALWIAGIPGKWLAAVIAACLPVLVFFVFKNPTRVRRILAVIPGHAEPNIASRPLEQIDHAMMALGSGGLTGLGPGASREKWAYLQEAHTDFIFAIIGEEFGLVGTCAVLVCMGLLIWGLVRMVRLSRTLFAAILAGGTATWVGVQTIINVTSVTGIGPVIGVPLPFISYGGSSFVFTAIAVGMVAGLARNYAGMHMYGKPRPGGVGRRDPRRRTKRKPAE